ncbi:hypothetical protein SAMN02745216_04855 [Desulfatibacillum alkenivorans DSM 16219]|jgi:hypothetical protein|uniref:Uncharacterized protein n=1 Tax=Desulfatibacillum alkenivorans DSM 16219 TaxID=1121393 RepID=A0A1M6YXW6_9BACT|nr:hypothetical protein [Desulfatibacillum alkenivorans]SHL22922.1 hypothetical protein SAMN02745216_04855 [Desulfatibacillum alkenivorans DSM 16219]
MAKPYIHIPLDEENRSISGYFTLEREVRLPYEGKEVLYTVGTGVVDSSCCGFGGCAYAMVPGFVVTWKEKKDLENRDISMVEPISDQESQKQLSKIIRKKEGVTQVNFL